jgi:hypothetical protein
VSYYTARRLPGQTNLPPEAPNLPAGRQVTSTKRQTSSKSQAPKLKQGPNIKFQIPNEETDSKFQTKKRTCWLIVVFSCFLFGICCFAFWSLFEIWCL